MSGQTASPRTITTNGINDLDLSEWKKLTEIWTDSLWIIDERDEQQAHQGGGQYHGNFVPQIPRQMMLRFTKEGDWVLDPFCGWGTTLIEARMQGRNCVGIDIQPEVAKIAHERAMRMWPYSGKMITETVAGDSRTVDLEPILEKHSFDGFQLAMLHPPYHDIIRFSDDPGDLSTIADYRQFRVAMRDVVEHVDCYMKPNGYIALVCGDKYTKGEWIPVAHDLMHDIRDCGYRLKATIVKNFGETKAKANQQALWRYRALRGGYYIFRHEYVFVLQKR